MRILTALLLYACAPALAQPAPCAIPMTRDRAGIVAAAASGCVELEAGEYTVVTPLSPSGGRRPYAVLALDSAELRGAGQGATTLHFTGNAELIDWHGISLTSGSVHDLTIETSALTGTSEQTHAIRVFGPVTVVSVYNVTLDHPVRGLQKGGDCIQLVGYAATPIIAARIHHNTFLHCDRSGVAAHSGVHDLEITDNVFLDTGDQDVDGEGSGSNLDWLIARNAFSTGPAAQGDIAIQLQLAERVRIVDNRFFGRGLFVYSAGQVEIARNSIVRTVPGGSAVVEIKKASLGVNIHDNTITRAVTAGTGYVIRATPQGTGTPSQLAIKHNTLTQSNTGDVINTVGMVGLHVDDNLVLYSGPPRGGYGVLANGSAGEKPIRSDDIRLSGNTWIGPLSGCIGISGSYGGVGSVLLLNEHAMSGFGGLVCGNAQTGSKISGPLISLGNSWPASTGCIGVP